MNNNNYIHGIGIYAPERILSNDDLSKFVDTNDEWISTRTGIKQRHILAEKEQNSDMAFAAAQEALKAANAQASEITHILLGTATPDYLCPSTATIVAHKLGCGNIMAFDFNAACTGFIYGLSLAKDILAGNPNAKILLICSEALTRKVNWEDRGTCVLFGDGAGALVLSNTQQGAQARILDVICHSDGSLQNLITIGGGSAAAYEVGTPIGDEFFLHMQGREVFKHAVRSMTAVCHEILERNNLSIEDINLFIPHQANLRIIESVGSRLPIDAEKVFTNVQKYGNMSAASIPVAMGEALNGNYIEPSQLVLLSAVGAGFTWGSGIVEFL